MIELSILNKIFCFIKNLSLKFTILNFSFEKPLEIFDAKFIFESLKLFFSSKFAICKILIGALLKFRLKSFLNTIFKIYFSILIIKFLNFLKQT